MRNLVQNVIHAKIEFLNFHAKLKNIAYLYDQMIN